MKLEIIELNSIEAINICGGGPIVDALSWYYQTMGSFYHGLYDGLTGK
jgi:hypothetical protein